MTTFVGLPFQQPSAENRFQRFHLRNGDTIDGRLYRENANDFEVRVEGGIIVLPRHQVVRVEGAASQPPVLPDKRPPSRPGPEGGLPRRFVIVPAHIVHSIKFRVDAAIAAVHRRVITREDGVRRLTECGPEGALYLASLLESLEPDLRVLASQGLVLLKNPATLPTLVVLFSSEDPEVRIAAATLMGTLGVPGSARNLRPLLRDREPSVRAAALEALAVLGDSDSLDYVSPLCADPDPAARTSALRATVEITKKHGLKENLLLALSRALKWPPKGGEGEILLAAGGCGEKEAWTLIVPHLSSPSEKTRAAAAGAVAMLGATDAGPSVVSQMAVELKPEPRIQLALAAEKLVLADAATPLIDWLADADESVRRAALRALRGLSGHSYGEDAAAWKAWAASR